MKKLLSPAFAIIALLIVIGTSCVKQKFDSPPDGTSYDPMIPVNKTVLALKDLYSGVPTLIDSDYVISGIVIADDRSGCFYKQIIIQDTTSGIVVLLGKSSGLYTDYPIGRKIYVKCKGLYLGAYGGFVQLGYTPDITNAVSDIPSALISKFIVKANTGNVVVPRTVFINQLASLNSTNKAWLGTLIRIDSTQFIADDVNSPYAQDPNVSSGTDRTIEDCTSKSIVARMSGYANFRNVLIPDGKGSFTAIFSRYNSTAQLLIRDTFDVKMNGTRCGGVVIQPAVDITIDSLRKLFPGTDTNHVTTLGNYKIHGVVSCSLVDSNVSKYNLILQDESGKGIVVYFSGSYGYKLGDSITSDVSGAQLKYYRGSLEVTGNATKTKLVVAGKTVTPKVVTIAALNTDLGNSTFNQRLYESVVVKVVNCTIAGTPTTYSGSKTINDGTGSIILYTSSYASFAAASCLTGTVSITGISTVYGKTVSACVNQISMRKLTDVQ